MSGAARAYHEATKHSYESVRRGPQLLDWGNKPAPFKVYRDLPRLRLPRETPPLGVTASEALSAPAPPGAARGAPDLDGVARLLWLGAGAHRRRVYPGGGVMHFRTYASAGALYPNEVYVACGDLEGLPAGVYHLDPREPALTRLREGDHRGFVVRAVGEEPAAAEAPLLVILSGIPWRTAWKYGDRGYRHLYWDAGMIVANLLAVARAERLPARVVLGFADSEIEALLGLEAGREFPLCVVALGSGAPVEPSAAQAPPATLEFEPPSESEREFPEIVAVNEAGRLAAADVASWRGRSAPEGAASGTEDLVSPARAAPSPDPLETVIRRRGSARVFARGSMPVGVLVAGLGPAVGGVPTDYAPGGSGLICAYLIANAVGGLPAGSYEYRDGGFRPLREGEFGRKAGFMCLEQRLAADAAAAHFLLCDLDRTLGAFGDRGYRAAQLEAGIAAGRIYLLAYAYGWGATGLTFYDDEVRRFFSPEAEALECMLVVCVGESIGRPTLRPVR